jgi:hypothetical protein
MVQKEMVRAVEVGKGPNTVAKKKGPFLLIISRHANGPLQRKATGRVISDIENRTGVRKSGVSSVDPTIGDGTTENGPCSGSWERTK